jgi:hypothetical protein
LAAARPRLPESEPAMTAILVIALFVVAIAALNYYEFGRVD